VVAASFIGGIFAWYAGETRFMHVEPVKVPQVVMGQPIMASTAKTQHAAELSTAMRTNGLFGAVLGLTFGLSGGLARRSTTGTAVGVLVGISLGAATGCITSYGALLLYEASRESLNGELLPSLLLHGAIWGSISAAAGLAFALSAGGGTQRMARYITGAILGALLGIVVFDMVGAIVFPNDETGEPVSTNSTARLLARLLVSLGTAVGIAAAGTIKVTHRSGEADRA
jgi:hypothetical protein